MHPLIPLVLITLNLPIYLHLKDRIFKDEQDWQRALSLSHDPELSRALVMGDWHSIASHLKLPAWILACGLLLLLEKFLMYHFGGF